MLVSKALKNLSFFNGLDTNSIVDGCTIYKYNKDSILYYESDNLSKLHFLVSGSCKAYKVSRDSEIFLYQLSGGSLISDFTLESVKCLSTVSFLSDSVVLSVDFKKIVSLYTSSLLKASILRNEILNDTLDINLTMDAVAKVAHFLSNDLELFNSIHRMDVAAMLNITHETVSRVLNRLVSGSIIKIDTKIITILDIENLVKLYK